MAAPEGDGERDAWLPEVTKALAADLAGLGEVSEEIVDTYMKSAKHGLESRGRELLKAYAWLGEVPGEKLKVMVSWPIDRAEETQHVVEKEWNGIWGKVPAVAQEHLDAALFKRTFLLNEGLSGKEAFGQK